LAPSFFEPVTSLRAPIHPDETRRHGLPGEPPTPHEVNAMKNQKRTRLQMTQIEATRKQLGERELSEVELKVVAGGLASQGGTCSACSDCDE
jgi:hypothetical protein